MSEPVLVQQIRAIRKEPTERESATRLHPGFGGLEARERESVVVSDVPPANLPTAEPERAPEEPAVGDEPGAPGGDEEE